MRIMEPRVTSTLRSRLHKGIREAAKLDSELTLCDTILSQDLPSNQKMKFIAVSTGTEKDRGPFRPSWDSRRMGNV